LGRPLQQILIAAVYSRGKIAVIDLVLDTVRINDKSYVAMARGKFILLAVSLKWSDEDCQRLTAHSATQQLMGSMESGQVGLHGIGACDDADCRYDIGSNNVMNGVSAAYKRTEAH